MIIIRNQYQSVLVKDAIKSKIEEYKKNDAHGWRNEINQLQETINDINGRSTV